MKIAFIVSKYPVLREQFIQREFEELSRNNINFVVYSLKSVKDELSNLHVDYAPFFSLKIFFTNLEFAFCHPSSYFPPLFEAVKYLHLVPLRLLKFFAVYPKTIYLAKVLKAQKVTHLHAHWANTPTSVAMTLAKILNLDFSFTCHAWDIHVPENTYWLEEKIKKASFILTCTQYNVDHLKRISPESHDKIYLNYHGVESFSYQRLQSQPPFIFAGGGFDQQKGFEILLMALDRLKKEKGENLPLFLFGFGRLEDDLKLLAKKWELNVEFLGRLPNEKVRNLMRQASFFVMPSVIPQTNAIDGIPNVILEAYHAQTAVIASNISGIPEIVKDGHNGWLVTSGSVEELAEVVWSAWKTPELCKQYGKEGYHGVTKCFDLTMNVQAMIEILQKHQNAI